MKRYSMVFGRGHKPSRLLLLLLFLAGCNVVQEKGEPSKKDTALQEASSVKPNVKHKGKEPPKAQLQNEKTGKLLADILIETGPLHAPVFLYRSAKFRKIVDNLCDYKEMGINIARFRILDKNEFMVLWQAMEHLPQRDYIDWMNAWIHAFKTGKADYSRLHIILFPSVDENVEFYFEYRDVDIVRFYNSLLKDSLFLKALDEDTSMEPYGYMARTYFTQNAANLLSGRTWENAKKSVMDCEIMPSRAPLGEQCPAETTREKMKKPLWWKKRCEEMPSGEFNQLVKDASPADLKPWWEDLEKNRRDHERN